MESNIPHQFLPSVGVLGGGGGGPLGHFPLLGWVSKDDNSGPGGAVLGEFPQYPVRADFAVSGIVNKSIMIFGGELNSLFQALDKLLREE